MKHKLAYILILSILGFLTSGYLIQNHYVPPTEGSFCDLSEVVSCSLVNTSTFSVLFNVPVAIFGALWFLILGILSYKAQKNFQLILPLLSWNIFGMLFVFYLIAAEIILQAICPLCTLVHVITLITFIISLVLYKNLSSKQKSIQKKSFVKSFKPYIILIVILNLIPIIALNINLEKTDYTDAAKCITANEVNMYGSFRCGICAKTREAFGDAFEHINEIECHPQGENPQTELCVSKELQGTPTWILEPNGEEVKRYTGFLSPEEVAEFAGCKIATENSDNLEDADNLENSDNLENKDNLEVEQ